MMRKNVPKYGIVIIFAIIWGALTPTIFHAETFGRWVSLVASVIGGGLIGFLVPFIMDLIDNYQNRKPKENIYLKSERNDVH